MVSDWVSRPELPRLVLGEVGPGQSQGLGSKAGIGRNGARAGSWIVYQGPYRTKCNQDRVRDWVPSLVWDEMGPSQGQGLGAKAGIG